MNENPNVWQFLSNPVSFSECYKTPLPWDVGLSEQGDRLSSLQGFLQPSPRRIADWTKKRNLVYLLRTRSLILGNPSSARDCISTVTLLAAFTPALRAGVSRSLSMLSSPSLAISDGSVQEGVVYSANDFPGRWWWADAAVILGCSLTILLVFFNVLRYLVQLLVDPCEPLLHRLHRVGDGELQVIYDLKRY